MTAAARRRHHRQLPHPLVLTALLFILIFCLSFRRLRMHCTSTRLGMKRDGSFLPSFHCIKSMHVRSKSKHQFWPHYFFPTKDVIIEDESDRIDIKMHLPNLPKSVRIKDVQVSLLDGGSTIKIQINSHLPPAQKKTHRNYMYDQRITLEDDIRINHNGMKTTLGKDGELTIVARKLNSGTESRKVKEAEDL